MSGQHVSAAGLRIYFEEYGEGKPSSSSWRSLHNRDILKASPVFLKHYRVLLPKDEGTTDPDVGGEFTYEVMVDDTMPFMDAMDLNDSVLSDIDGRQQASGRCGSAPTCQQDRAISATSLLTTDSGGANT